MGSEFDSKHKAVVVKSFRNSILLTTIFALLCFVLLFVVRLIGRVY